MKRSTTLFLLVLSLALASCGTSAQLSQQRFQDGIYLKPGAEPEPVRLYTQEDFEAMAAANIARKQGRDTLVVILEDPWDYGWRYPYYSWAPWAWGGLGFGVYYWDRWRFGRWYDPWFYDPWYGPRYAGWYGPRYGYYGWGHRYGWYDHPGYPGGYWGGRYRGNVVYTPRSATQSGGPRTMHPGSGYNYRYGTAGSAGGSAIGGRTSVRRSVSGTGSGAYSGSSSSSTTRSRSAGYNPQRGYGSSRSVSGTRAETQRSSGNATYSNPTYGSSGASRSGGYSGGGYSGGGFGGAGGSSHSGGGGTRSGGGRR